VNSASRSIVLIGFMGTGKSSVGRHLARLQGWRCFDTDAMIANALRMPISEIFFRFGEERFRDEETAVLEKLTATPSSVIVAGGGAILRSRNVVRLRELGTVVWLTADLETLCDRLAQEGDRPLLPKENRSATIEKLLRERESLYKATAHLTVDTSSLEHEQVADSIRHALAFSR
jgi:shikimate kinase